VACPACIARSASRPGPAADWHAGKVAASGRSIRPTRLTQGGPRYSQKHRGDLQSAAPEFRLVHLLGVRLARPTPTVIARNVSLGSIATVSPAADDFRSAPTNGHQQTCLVRPVGAKKHSGALSFTAGMRGFRRSARFYLISEIT
jgi:hypothetical protein